MIADFARTCRGRDGNSEAGGLSAGAADRVPQRGSIEVFSQVHQGKKCVEDSRFHFVGQMQAACRSAGEHFAIFRDESYNFSVPRVRRFAVHSFSSHLRAVFFDLQSEVEYAQVNGFQAVWHLSLASMFAARG
jgi:hypothetical protein